MSYVLNTYSIGNIINLFICKLLTCRVVECCKKIHYIRVLPQAKAFDVAFSKIELKAISLKNTHTASALMMYTFQIDSQFMCSYLAQGINNYVSKCFNFISVYFLYSRIPSNITLFASSAERTWQGITQDAPYIALTTHWASYGKSIVSISRICSWDVKRAQILISRCRNRPLINLPPNHCNHWFVT